MPPKNTRPISIHLDLVLGQYLMFISCLQSDEDEDNYDEVRYRIEQSIIKERLTRLATYGSPESSPMSGDAATEEQGAAKGSISCDAIHKRFNINSCYLCKNATAKDKREEKKKSNFGSCLCIPALSVFHAVVLM